MVKFSIIVWISVVAFLNNGNVKPVESEDSNAKADEKYENVLQELKAIKREVENYRKTSTRLLQENKIMKNELDKLHVNDQIQAKMIANKRLKRSKRDESTCAFGQNQSPVAFTAYLDHHKTNLGVDQAIVYNKVLLNKGAAYNVYNGMFTAPKSGIYIFSWSSAARQTGAIFDIWISLVVNASTQTTAVAESRLRGHDHQGSSTVIIHVNKGDVVWTKRLSSGGAEIHSEPERRVSSFTGALLFAED